ncbi:hypothetical protein [Sutcliffiella horikoshii]|uniref:hypothetical protein n=1 Tax=Sutcliffiella horikoshii TaxID=79883 RepID=UPI00384F8B4F
MRKFAVVLFSILLLGVSISLELEGFELSSPIHSVTSVDSFSELELVKPASTKKLSGSTDNSEVTFSQNGYFNFLLPVNKISLLIRGPEYFPFHLLFPHMYQSNYLSSSTSISNLL